MAWERFPHYWPFVMETTYNQRIPLMSILSIAWTTCWANNRVVGDFMTLMGRPCMLQVALGYQTFPGGQVQTMILSNPVIAWLDWTQPWIIRSLGGKYDVAAPAQLVCNDVHRQHLSCHGIDKVGKFGIIKTFSLNHLCHSVTPFLPQLSFICHRFK